MGRIGHAKKGGTAGLMHALFLVLPTLGLLGGIRLSPREL